MNWARLMGLLLVVIAWTGCETTGGGEVPPADRASFDAPREPSRAEEVRGVWISSSYYSSEKEEAALQMREALDGYAAAGVTDLFCFGALPDQHALDWDFLAVLLEEAHARSMRVHPCICPGHVYPGWEEEVERHPEWLVRNWKESPPRLNFAVAEVRDFIVGKVAGALKYDIDGIQLDGIRFETGLGFSYDRATREAFKAEYGRGPLELRWRNCGSVLWCEWMRWNATHVTALVRGIKDLIGRSGRDIPLSAAVFPDGESSRLLVGQDWRRWIEEGIVDLVCPMIYTNNHEVFRRYTRQALDAAGGKCPVCPGIAVRSSHNRNTPEGVGRQVEISREEGARGVVFFSGATLKGDFLDVLSR